MKPFAAASLSAKSQARHSLDFSRNAHRQTGERAYRPDNHNTIATGELTVQARSLAGREAPSPARGIAAAAEGARPRATATAEMLWEHDLVNDVISRSCAFAAHFGYSPDDSHDSYDWWSDRIHPDDRARVLAHRDGVGPGTETETSCEYRFRRSDGSYADILAQSWIMRNANGEATRTIGCMIDLSPAKAAAQALSTSEERLRLATLAGGFGIADYDIVTGEAHWSPKLCEILGVDAGVASSWDKVAALLEPEERDVALVRHNEALDGELARNNALYRITRPSDGAKRWVSTESAQIFDAENRAVRLIVNVKDVTDEKTAHDRIAWIANHDPVTRLPNRTAFHAELEVALALARSSGGGLALMLIDLDNFKYINDTLGHQAGDAALAVLASRISEVIPDDAIAARIGGDEFAVLLPKGTRDTATDLAGRILAWMQRPFTVEDRSTDLRASIGVGLYPGHGESATELIQSADIALYAAKSAGRATFKLFEAELRSGLQRQVSMLSQARLAVDRGWIEPHYQPQVEIATGRVVGFEALLRWRHPAAGLQMPDSIAAAFDDPGIADLIGEAMTDAVVRDIAQWRDRGIDVGKVGINASAAEFRAAGYARRLLARLNVHGIDAGRIEVEITETALLSDRSDIVHAELKALRDAGIAVALDDFGTGCSSLSHLRRFPVDAIKIDRSFVAGIGKRDGDCAIIDAVLRLGDAFGLVTIAEGVETARQAKFIAGLGCTIAQGYHYSPPVSASEVPAMVAGKPFAALSLGPSQGIEAPRWLSLLGEL
jgi:diguanylate cyclase (GGDEF)-like protein/PAS domain S-box-containing protein